MGQGLVCRHLQFRLSLDHFIWQYDNVIRLSPYLPLSLINLPSARVATFRSDATSTGSQARSDDIHIVGKNIPLSHLILMLVRTMSLHAYESLDQRFLISVM